MTCIIDLNLAGQSFNTLKNLQASLSENLSDVLMISCSGGSRPSDKGAGAGGVWGHADPEIREVGSLTKNYLWPFGPQFGLKIRVSSPASAAVMTFMYKTKFYLISFFR